MAQDFFEPAYFADKPAGHSFLEKESKCKELFNTAMHHFGTFLHLHTPENHPVVFHDDKDYRAAMTIVAICAHDCPDIKIITFELMSNHVHFVLCGDEEACRRFFALFKERLKQYFHRLKRIVDLSEFEPKVVHINTLESLRNQIGYTNRNNFVVNAAYTPFSYPYGAGNCYFLPANQQQADTRFGHLTFREKRALLHSHQMDYPADYAIIDGYISPASCCAISFGEHIFRDARHYFFKISRDIESYKEIAEVLGESIFYTDDELSAILYKKCQDDYGGLQATLLPHKDKLELARLLHFDYNADNDKVARLLKLSPSLVNSIYPLRKK